MRDKIRELRVHVFLDPDPEKKKIWDPDPRKKKKSLNPDQDGKSETPVLHSYFTIRHSYFTVLHPYFEALKSRFSPLDPDPIGSGSGRTHSFLDKIIQCGSREDSAPSEE
jgi:hypothetical protein